MPELSIIVPVYKVERYLNKCVDSILAQTYTNFEVILIDDGSPDNCGKICDEYAEKDSRVVVIHQENAGVSAARNAGLTVAKGEYIGFVDSDDWIEPCMYEVMMSTIKEENVDIVACQCIADRIKKNIELNSKDEVLLDLFSKPSMALGVLWNKVYKRECIGNCTFEKGIRIQEDLLFLTQITVSNANCAYILADKLYNYRIRDNSASSSKLPYYDIRVFKHHIIPLLEEYDACIANMAIEYLIDSSIQLKSNIKSAEASWIEKRVLFLRIKVTIARWCRVLKQKGMSDSSAIHRFIYEGVVK